MQKTRKYIEMIQAMEGKWLQQTPGVAKTQRKPEIVQDSPR